jgi:hypothetical protein
MRKATQILRTSVVSSTVAPNFERRLDVPARAPCVHGCDGGIAGNARKLKDGEVQARPSGKGEREIGVFYPLRCLWLERHTNLGPRANTQSGEVHPCSDFLGMVRSEHDLLPTKRLFERQEFWFSAGRPPSS